MSLPDAHRHIVLAAKHSIRERKRGHYREKLENQQIWIDVISLIVGALIVTQTIVELAGELVYIKIVPKWILRTKGEFV